MATAMTVGGRFDLSALEWSLSGWRPLMWRSGWEPEVGPVPASIPGSVQQALRAAGVIPDWQSGTGSRDCEWVEHRHWELATVVPGGVVPTGAEVTVEGLGLDYSGWVLVDGVEAAAFRGALLPHRMAIGLRLSDGSSHRLSVVFDCPPPEQGQVGYTSLSRYFKPRYSYSWDWCPRIVPVGVTDELSLVWDPTSAFDLRSVRTDLDEGGAGRVKVAVEVAEAGVGCSLRVVLGDYEDDLAAVAVDAAGTGVIEMLLEDLAVTPWWPNGMGPSNLYRLSVHASDQDGTPIWAWAGDVGFKRVRWLPCEGAAADAWPWICEVNGRPVFLQGVNWTPARDCYPDATYVDYQCRVELYRDMGCNILRVWGGAFLERRVFYELCDRAGLLVWQELPLSSSGLENAPPDDPEAITELSEIARSYVRRRGHHVCLLLWCGGNELTLSDAEQPLGAPVDAGHPCIAALEAVMQEEDPTRRFLATSPSGPRFYAAPGEADRQLYHDVHGPWTIGEVGADLEDWRRYWEEDVALFRSEVGCPSASAVEVLDRFSAGQEVWPPTTDYWRHSSPWWSQWARLRERFEGLEAREGLEAYVGFTQDEQATALAFAAAACKARFPRCGGFLVWMGHDCFPCAANNSIIDVAGNPKPAYFSLLQVYRGTPS